MIDSTYTDSFLAEIAADAISETATFKALHENSVEAEATIDWSNGFEAEVRSIHEVSFGMNLVDGILRAQGEMFDISAAVTSNFTDDILRGTVTVTLDGSTNITFDLDSSETAGILHHNIEGYDCTHSGSWELESEINLNVNSTCNFDGERKVENIFAFREDKTSSGLWPHGTVFTSCDRMQGYETLLIPVSEKECPQNSISATCDQINSGQLCEGNGECGTNNDLNNCGDLAIYRKVRAWNHNYTKSVYNIEMKLADDRKNRIEGSMRINEDGEKSRNVHNCIRRSYRSRIFRIISCRSNNESAMGSWNE